MTFKTILAAASGGSASDGTVELACRFARRFGAHLEAFHAKPDPRDLFTYSTDSFGTSMSGDFVDRFVKDADSIASKTKVAFETTVARHQIPVSAAPSLSLPEKIAASAVWREEVGYAPTLVARRARFFDLVVLGRSDRVVDQPHTDVVEQTLINSGRPVLVAPAQAPGDVGDTVAIGWNGSAEATRALTASLPFLASASVVSIITIGDHHKGSAAALVEYLGWYGVAAKHRHMPAVGGAGIGQQLLSAAHEQNASLLVMGGYGQVPWREFLFGGATREVVGASLLPLLLTH
ncbi:MAG TPA: universal stress protein [Stellaceae bacterium]|jgi:nucleotide-binding universal stress UspA family protein